MAKFNIGDAVMIPGRIVAIKESDTGGIAYEVDSDIWRIPETAVRSDDGGMHLGLMQFERAIREKW